MGVSHDESMCRISKRVEWEDCSAGLEHNLTSEISVL